MSRFRRPLRTSPDDPRLLESAISLGQQLDISKLNLKDVRWMEWIPAGPIPSDWCFFLRHSIVMPAHMIGKLAIEEWRPLIASSILYEKKLVPSLRGKSLVLFGLPTILFLTGIFVSTYFLRNALLLVIILVPLFISLSIGSRKYSSYLKRTRLEADTQASVLTGKDSFLDVLRKIDMMGLVDIERLKTDKRSRRDAGLPNITERIENLSRLRQRYLSNILDSARG